MAMIKVEAWDLHFKDPVKNSDKYYKVYVSELGHYLLHWGRVYTAGQIKVDRLPKGEANDGACKQVYAKLAKGYREQRHAFFMVETSDFTNVRKLEQKWAEHEKNETLISNGHASELVSLAIDAENLVLAVQTRDPSELGDLFEEVMKLRERHDILKEQASKADAAMTILGLVSQARMIGAR